MAKKTIFNPLTKKGFDKISVEDTSEFIPIPGTDDYTFSMLHDVVSVYVNTYYSGIQVRVVTKDSFPSISATAEPRYLFELSGCDEVKYNGLYRLYKVSNNEWQGLFRDGTVETPRFITGNFGIRFISENLFKPNGSALIDIVNGAGRIRYNTLDVGTNPICEPVGGQTLDVGKKFRIAASASNFSNLYLPEVLRNKVMTIVNDAGTTFHFTVDGEPTLNLSLSSFDASNTRAVVYPLDNNLVKGLINTDTHPIDDPDFNSHSLVDKESVQQMIDPHITDTNNPHNVTATQIGLDQLTNDKQIPLAGTVQSSLGDGPYAIYGGLNNYDGTYILVTYLVTTFSIGDTIELTGSPSGFNGFYIIDDIQPAGFTSGHDLTATRITEPLVAATSFFSTFYFPSAEVVEPTIPAEPVTGNIQFSAQPDTLTGFDTLSVITKGILDDFNGKEITTTTTTPYNAVVGEHILVDATGGNKTVNLPTAVGVTGKIIIVCKSDATANTVTVDANGAETINGALTKVLSSAYESYEFKSDGTNWIAR